LPGFGIHDLSLRLLVLFLIVYLVSLYRSIMFLQGGRKMMRTITLGNKI
jgi:hypothetical protein